jgi:hypothetical protein
MYSVVCQVHCINCSAHKDSAFLLSFICIHYYFFLFILYYAKINKFHCMLFYRKSEENTVMWSLTGQIPKAIGHNWWDTLHFRRSKWFSLSSCIPWHSLLPPGFNWIAISIFSFLNGYLIVSTRSRNTFLWISFILLMLTIDPVSTIFEHE